MGAETLKMEDLGYNSYFGSEKTKPELGDLTVARVIARFKNSYKVKNQNGEFLAKITGKQMFKAQSNLDYPAVGDWVSITQPDKEHAAIQKILPRQSIIKRRFGNKNKLGEKDDTQVIATNIDVAFIVESVDRDYNLNRFERYFAIARNGNVEPVIILNKIDLLSEEQLNLKIKELKNRFPKIDIIPTSLLNNTLDNLKDYILQGKTYCFLGSSGVGKSSLINKLLDKNIIKTGDISSSSSRGKHTTTERQMYFLKNGGIVIDNPGIREVGLTDSSQGISLSFDEISSLSKKCKYTDCTHINEPGCKVLEAKQNGSLEEAKYLNYINLKKETEYFDMSELEKNEKDYRFGKFMKKAKKELKKRKSL